MLKDRRDGDTLTGLESRETPRFLAVRRSFPIFVVFVVAALSLNGEPKANEIVNVGQDAKHPLLADG